MLVVVCLGVRRCRRWEVLLRLRVRGLLVGLVEARRVRLVVPVRWVPGVTADSLSDPEAEYAVVSVPEGLDATQGEVLSAFVAYDRASWTAVRDMDGTSEVEATATGQELASFTKGYKDHEAKGQHVEGSSSVEVSAVDLLPDGVTASVGVCNDQTKGALVSATGEDQTPEDVRHRFPIAYTLVRQGSGWKVASSSQGEADQC